MAFAEALLLVGLVAFVLFTWHQRKLAEEKAKNPLSLPLPPGPPGLPAIGNVLDWPQGSPWTKFVEWQKEYGDINHVTLLGQHVVITNSLELSHDLMEQHSDRPDFVMAGDLMGLGKSTPLSPYDAHWKFVRKLTRYAISKPVVPKYWPYLESDARELVRQVALNPAGYRDGIRFVLARNIMKTSYGLEINTLKHEYVKLAESVHQDLAFALLPGSYLVDVFPILKKVPSWFPGAGFKRLAAMTSITAWKMVNQPYNYVKNAFASGSAPPSFVAHLLEEESAINYDPPNWEMAVKWAAASLYGAAMESSNATLNNFVLFMAMYPEIQAKAQAELDAAVGKDRFPTMEDRPNLPYTEAILKEVFRWHPPLPIGVPHKSMEDSYYKEYYIPKGTMVVQNQWAIGRDPALYHEPETFKPERFLGDKAEHNPYSWVFGGGRRECPGKHYATSFMFITLASLLGAFYIRAEDAEGNPVKVAPKFAPNFTSYALEFPCRITARSSALAEMLKEDAQNHH